MGCMMIPPPRSEREVCFPTVSYRMSGILRIRKRGHLSTGKMNCVRVTKFRKAKVHRINEERMEHKHAASLNRENAVGIQRRSSTLALLKSIRCMRTQEGVLNVDPLLLERPRWEIPAGPRCAIH